MGDRYNFHEIEERWQNRKKSSRMQKRKMPIVPAITAWMFPIHRGCTWGMFGYSIGDDSQVQADAGLCVCTPWVGMPLACRLRMLPLHNIHPTGGPRRI